MTFAAETMPPSKRKLVKIELNVPEELLDDAKRLFDAIGISYGDGYRDAWMAGVYHMAERHNKILVNRKLLSDPAKPDETGNN